MAWYQLLSRGRQFPEIQVCLKLSAKLIYGVTKSFQNKNECMQELNLHKPAKQPANMTPQYLHTIPYILCHFAHYTLYLLSA